jgi:hypothetical protein
MLHTSPQPPKNQACASFLAKTAACLATVTSPISSFSANPGDEHASEMSELDEHSSTNDEDSSATNHKSEATKFEWRHISEETPPAKQTQKQ